MIKIYLPNTPSYFVGEVDIRRVKKVKMTCGGGMGGSCWYEYILCDTMPENLSYGLINVVNYRGEKITLNTSYIVKIEGKQVANIITNSQNPTYGGVKRFFYEIPCGETVELCNDYGKTEEQHGIELIEIVDCKIGSEE